MVNVLHPVRIWLEAEMLNLHPNYCTAQIFQGICIERVLCVKIINKKEARMRDISYPALALNSMIFQICQINYIFRACIIEL